MRSNRSNNRLNFFADITVNPEALPGTTDTILIGLADMDGTIIAEATVEAGQRSLVRPMRMNDHP